MRNSWDDHADEWDSNQDVILYSERAYSTLSEIVNIEGLNILDFGCGTGLLTERMSPTANRILALDSSDKMISVLRNKQFDNVDVLVADLSKESIETNELLHVEFDLIVASSVCAFLSDYDRTLGLLKTLLKPTGIFIQWDWLKLNEESEFGLTKERIESAFDKGDLETKIIAEAFSLESGGKNMKVIMGVAKNS